MPLLKQSVVDPGWVSRDAFIAGYGAAQALPGPLFAFAAFLGAAARGAPNGRATSRAGAAAVGLGRAL